MRVVNNSAGAAATLLTLLVSGCGDDPLVSDIVVRVEVTPSSDTLTVGQIATPFSATAFNARGETILDALFTWRSDQPFIAAVDSLTGAVTGRSVGVAAVTARAGAVSDTGEVFVISPLALSLPVDSLLLAPGDTLTIPVTLTVRDGQPSPAVTFAGGAPAVATVDPATGLITAVASGAVGFEVRADTLVARGGIEVVSVQDTSIGPLYLALSGGINRTRRLGARARNHPTNDGGSAVQLNGVESAAALEQFVLLLVDSIVGPRLDAVGLLRPEDIGATDDPVCFPPGSWAFYRDSSSGSTLFALSQAGGSVGITQVSPIPGGRAVSGRFDVTLQRSDIAGTAPVRALGTFVVPLTDLASCPS